MAVTVMENVSPELLLENPKEVLEELPSRSEFPREDENAGKTRQIVLDRVRQENEERRTRGLRFEHNIYYNEVQKIVKSRQSSFLETEDEALFVQKISASLGNKLEI